MKNIKRQIKFNPVTIIFISLLTIVSCQKEESEYEKRVKIDDNTINEYLTDNGIDVQKHPSGFYYEVVESNNGGDMLYKDDVIDLYYKISLLDGTVLEETSQAEGKPARFKLLNNAVIPQGLDDGISLMKSGEKYRFYIPSYLAYGSYSNSLFSAYSIFIVEAEVIKKQSETDIDISQLDSIDSYVKSNYPGYEKFASGLYYVDSITGTGDKPYAGNMVTINFTRKYLNDTIIKTMNDVSLYLGSGQAVQGLDEGIKQMREGGKAILIMPASIAFKQSLCLLPEKIRQDLLRDDLINAEVRPYSIVKYIVELKSVN